MSKLDLHFFMLKEISTTTQIIFFFESKFQNRAWKRKQGIIYTIDHLEK